MTISPEQKIRLSIRDYLIHVGVLLAWSVGGMLWLDRRFSSLENGRENHSEKIAEVVKVTTQLAERDMDHEKRLIRLER